MIAPFSRRFANQVTKRAKTRLDYRGFYKSAKNRVIGSGVPKGEGIDRGTGWIPPPHTDTFLGVLVL